MDVLISTQTTYFMDKAAIKEQIEKQILKTEDAIEKYQGMVQPISPDDAIGRISRMDAIVNKSVVEASLRQAERKLTKLKVMQTKIDDDNFGLCERCKKPIPIQRILLMPQSAKCVRCASR